MRSFRYCLLEYDDAYSFKKSDTKPSGCGSIRTPQQKLQQQEYQKEVIAFLL